MKRFAFFLFFLLSFLALERFCHKQTRGFCISNIASCHEGAYQSPSLLPEDLDAIFSQPFYFLDSGLECYAFLSEDKKWVLKTFKQHHVRQARLLNFIKFFPPLSNFVTKYVRVREDRLKNSFRSFELAYKELMNETQLVAVHLGESQELKRSVTLVDKLGIVHTASLDSLDFLLQKKGDLLIPHLQRLLKEGKIEEAKASLTSLLNLIVRCSKLGIADRDPTLSKNMGFIGNEAFLIDVGSFSKNPFISSPREIRQTLFYETLPLRCLLAKEFPDLLDHLDAEIDHALKELV